MALVSCLVAIGIMTFVRSKEGNSVTLLQKSREGGGQTIRLKRQSLGLKSVANVEVP